MGLYELELNFGIFVENHEILYLLKHRKCVNCCTFPSEAISEVLQSFFYIFTVRPPTAHLGVFNLIAKNKNIWPQKNNNKPKVMNSKSNFKNFLALWLVCIRRYLTKIISYSDLVFEIALLIGEFYDGAFLFYLLKSWALLNLTQKTAEWPDGRF